MDYFNRAVDDELDLLLSALPAVAIDGAKAVGKTSTAQRRCAAAVFLDSSAVRVGVAADPTSILARPYPLLIDEWKKVPEVWDVVRRTVDNDRKPGQYLRPGCSA